MICPRCGAETSCWPCPECGFPEIMKNRWGRRSKWRRINSDRHCSSRYDFVNMNIEELMACEMTREQLDEELRKGVDSIKAGKIYSADEADAELENEFNI